MVSDPPAVTTRPRRLSPPVLVLVVLLTGTAAWLFGPRWPLGRSGEWEITVNATDWPLSAWGLPLVVLGLFGGLALYFAYDRFKRATSRRAQSISTALCVIALSALAGCWPWALLEPGGAVNLVNVAWSDVSNEYFGTAYQISDVRVFTRDYVEQHQRPTARAQAHVATHPPGATLFYYAARRVFESSPALQTTFIALTERLAGASLSTVATGATQVRIAATRGAGIAQVPAPLPNEAAACALWCAFLLSCAVAATVPAVYLLAASVALPGVVLNNREDVAQLGGVGPLCPPWVAGPHGRKSAAPTAGTEARPHQALLNTSLHYPDNLDEAPAEAPSAAHSAGAAEARGLLAAALFATAPSAQLFAFTLDALIACGVAWALVCVARRVGGGAAWWLVVAGTVLGLTSFISIGVLAGLVIAGLTLVLRGPRAPRVWLPDLLFIGGGFLTLWLLLMVALPMQPVAMLQHALAAHHFATLDYRNRWGWMGLNLVTFALFAGWALTVAVGWLLLSSHGTEKRQRVRYSGVGPPCPPSAQSTSKHVGLRHTAGTEARPHYTVQRFLHDTNSRTPGEIIGYATLLTVLLLTLSGSVRGEVERLWLFLLPPLCALAAAAFRSSQPEADDVLQRLNGWQFFLVAQALQTLLMAVAFEPLSRPF